MRNRFAICVAGGTGGHINAAIAVGEELECAGFNIQYFTGQRPLDYKLFQGKNTRHLESRPLRTSNPIQLIRNILSNYEKEEFATISKCLIVLRNK